jgi:uncharacterized protein YdeI (YjbR/CyaY-like superfamily)
MGQKVVFFATPARFRAWLEKHHASKGELWVGFHKKATGNASMPWPEAVEEALCFGWIDGVRRSIDETSYMNRFTPRNPASNWSARNVATVERLIADGRIRPAGLEAFERRRPDRTGICSYEQRDRAQFSAAEERRFRAKKRAWTYFQGRPPGYRALATWWVVSARREDTRERRLDALIQESAQGKDLNHLSPPRRRKS